MNCNEGPKRTSVGTSRAPTCYSDMARQSGNLYSFANRSLGTSNAKKDLTLHEAALPSRGKPLQA